MQHIEDKNAPIMSGYIAIVLILLATFGLFLVHYSLTVVPLVLTLLLLTGFSIVEPNEARVLTFLGQYVGTIRQSGFIFSIPFAKSTAVSTRYINFNTGTIKVNDLRGNPIEIGAVVVWRVKEPAKAVLNVINCEEFVSHQSEIAIRGVAAKYAYDGDDTTSLRGNTHEVSTELVRLLQEKLEIAGVEIKEVRLSNLSYSSEIAAAMLRQQQAQAIVQARSTILQNAVTLADGVIQHLNQQLNSPMSDEVKVNLMSNLLVVLVSEKESAPVISVGR